MLKVLASFLLLSLSSTSLVVAHGATVETGSGTFADLTASYVPTSQLGATTVFAVSGSGTVTGALSGTYSFSGTLQANDQTGVIHYVLTDIFSVVVDGKSGTITVSEIGGGSAVTNNFASRFNILGGTGDLASMSGQGALQGTQDPATLLDTGTYTITYFFG